MRDALQWLKDAMASKDIVGHMTHALVKDGMIHGTDGRMTAAHPFPDKRTFLVSFDDLQKVLDRMNTDEPKIEVGKDAVSIKHGRLRATIQTMDPTTWAYPGIEAKKWKKIGHELIESFSSLRPFVSDNATQAWAMCIWIADGRLYATNNIALAAAELPELKDLDKVMIPSWAIDFILKRTDGLEKWVVTENYVGFSWKNGAWMRTQLINAAPPDSVKGLIDGVGKPKHEIKPDWVEAYNRVSSLSNDEVRFYAGKMTGGRNMTSVEEEAKSLIPKGIDYIAFDPRFLSPVIAAASHWQPDVFPKPVPFRGSRLKGLVVGRKG